MVRWPVASVLLLVSLAAASSDAGTVALAWDWDATAAQRAAATYRVRLTYLVNGKPTATTVGVVPLSSAACQQWPVMRRTAITLCGSVCLNPGDYTLTLAATVGGVTTGESNALDLDLTTEPSCEPSPIRAIVPPPPPPSSLPRNRAAPITAGALVALLAAKGIQNASAPSLNDLMSPGCIAWKVLGPCFCNPTTPCLSVEYYEPAYLVEVVKRPGETILDVLSEPLSAALSAVGGAVGGGGGAANATGQGQTNLHYSEAHVWTLPNLLGGPCTSCGGSPDQMPVLNFASEADPIWRTASASTNPINQALRIGVWALLYPRGGKVITGSGVVASGVNAVRAMDIAHQPIGTPPNTEAHVVLDPLPTRETCFQLAWPHATACMAPGVPPALWDHGLVSVGGKYAWLVYKKRSCCVLPNQTTCGITLLSGVPTNTCVLPALP